MNRDDLPGTAFQCGAEEGQRQGSKKKGALSVAISYTNYSNATVRGIHGP
jgi:hypothetical protein